MSHSIQPIPVVAEYARQCGGPEIPVIAEVFRPNRGWIRYSFKKRLSRAWLRVLQNEGVTSVGLDMGDGRIADFTLRELLRVPQQPMKIPVSAGTR